VYAQQGIHNKGHRIVFFVDLKCSSCRSLHWEWLLGNRQESMRKTCPYSMWFVS